MADPITKQYATNYSQVSATEYGTKIIKQGESGMDKNAFLTILCAQLSNQDPTQDVDSSAYVAQLAQFSALEQMQNLNTTMTSSYQQGLVGKGVSLKMYDDEGKQITGIVQGVTGSTIHLIIDNNGTNKEINANISDIESVINVSDYTITQLGNIDGKLNFMTASSYVDKPVMLFDKDEKGNYLQGKVTGAYSDNGSVFVRVELSSGETKDFAFDKVYKVGDFEEIKKTETNEEGNN